MDHYNQILKDHGWGGIEFFMPQMYSANSIDDYVSSSNSIELTRKFHRPSYRDKALVMLNRAHFYDEHVARLNDFSGNLEVEVSRIKPDDGMLIGNIVLLHSLDSIPKLIDFSKYDPGKPRKVRLFDPKNIVDRFRDDNLRPL